MFRIGVHSTSKLFALMLTGMVAPFMDKERGAGNYEVRVVPLTSHSAHVIVGNTCGIADIGDDISIVEMRPWADALLMEGPVTHSDSEGAQVVADCLASIKMQRRRDTRVIGLVASGREDDWRQWIKNENVIFIGVTDGGLDSLANALPTALLKANTELAGLARAKKAMAGK